MAGLDASGRGRAVLQQRDKGAVVLLQPWFRKRSGLRRDSSAALLEIKARAPAVRQFVTQKYEQHCSDLSAGGNNDGNGGCQQGQD
jgi:hypothetical protein